MTMRLIDSDALSSDICKDCNAVQNGACNYDICPLVAWIEEAPTIEAEPVRHGEWVHTDKAASWKCKDECGECHYHTADRVDLSCFNYCPNCGAKMDGGCEK
jgi:hypothetical protein